jgi:rhamnosyl/mannosyltransferase
MVMPSPNRAEAFGMSLLEAAMMGKPMITCEIGTGTSFVNEHGKTGLVVAPNDPAELARAMRELWDDPQLCERMGRRAALRFEDHFTASRTAASYRQIYQTVIDERNSGRSTVLPTVTPRNVRITTASAPGHRDVILEKQ